MNVSYQCAELKTMMGLLVLFLLSCALCVLNPTGAHSAHCDRSACMAQGRALLRTIADTLAMDHLFRGLNCTEQTAAPHNTPTLSICTPKEHSLCLLSNDLIVNREECLQNVLEDLRYYWTELKSYSDPDQVLEQSVLKIIETLSQSCFSATVMDSKFQASTEHENSFKRRLKLCKVLKAFQIRTITITRVMNHILSARPDLNHALL